jgi:serine/threonine protein kinase
MVVEAARMAMGDERRPGPGWWVDEDGTLRPPIEPDVGDVAGAALRVASTDTASDGTDSAGLADSGPVQPPPVSVLGGEGWGGTPLRDGDPRRLGDWELVGRLGAGGMGVVYLGRRNDRFAAVKVISSGLAADPSFIARFEREVRLCEKVRSPFVAELVAADPIADTPWLATEYVSGPTLFQRVTAEGALGSRALHQLAVGAAGALVAIHAVGVVHRDLKPSNVILTADGPVVIDFGVAAAGDATTLTSVGAALGSPGWMAPEQIRGEPVSAAADVFAWGALVAFAATGRAPFGAGRPEALAYRVVHEAPDLEGMTGDLAGIARVALSPEPAHRPTSTGLVELLAAGASGVPSPVPRTAIDGTAVQSLALRPSEDSVTSASTRPTGKVVAAVAIVVVVLSVAAGVAFEFGRRARETSPETVAANEPVASVTTVAPNEPVQSTSEVDVNPTEPVEVSTLIPNGSEEDIVITVPHGADPPDMPTGLEGWRPIGPLNSGEIRVFEGEGYAYNSEIGPSRNSCGDGLWTARWRSRNDAITVRAALEYQDLAGASSDIPEQLATAEAGGAGYVAGFICQTPIFAWGNGQDASTLVDVVIEWQEWEPAV